MKIGARKEVKLHGANKLYSSHLRVNRRGEVITSCVTFSFSTNVPAQVLPLTSLSQLPVEARADVTAAFHVLDLLCNNREQSAIVVSLR